MTAPNAEQPEPDSLAARLEKALIDGDYMNWPAHVNAARLAAVVHEWHGSEHHDRRDLTQLVIEVRKWFGPVRPGASWIALTRCLESGGSDEHSG